MAAKRRTQPQPKNVLVVRFTAIGDVAMTIPVVYSACRCFPDTEFYMVTRPTMATMMVNAPSNLHLIEADLKNEYGGFGGMRRLLQRVMSEAPIDTLIDLQGSRVTAPLRFFARMAGIKIAKIALGISNKRALTRKHNKVMLPLVSQRARYREAFFRAGIPITSRFDGFYGLGKADPQIFAHITPPKAEGEKWVGIAPFAKSISKIYPLHLMERVIEQLVSNENIKVFLFGGGAEESAKLAEWAAKYPRVTSLADKRQGFPVELALLSHVDVMLSMDSANMHLASMVNIPVVSVWGATHTYCGFKGWHQLDENTVQLPMPCRPCSITGDKPCHRGDYYCLAGINPSTILEKLKRFLWLTSFSWRVHAFCPTQVLTSRCEKNKPSPPPKAPDGITNQISKQ